MVSCISPEKFHRCFVNWMRECHVSDENDIIAIDGKTLRGSYDRSRRRGAIHVISAFSTMNSLVLGQIKTNEKSNEITAMPELINLSEIKGKLITTDAMGCQKDIAEKFPLKEINNPEYDSYATTEKSHGREEKRAGNAGQILYNLSRFNGKKVCHSNEKSLEHRK